MGWHSQVSFGGLACTYSSVSLVSTYKNRDETYRNEDQGDADSLSSENERNVVFPKIRFRDGQFSVGVANPLRNFVHRKCIFCACYLALVPGAAFERSRRARTSRTTSTEKYLVVLDSCALPFCSLPFLRQIMHLDSHRITAD
jgi:hypothetical protein